MGEGQVWGVADGGGAGVGSSRWGRGRCGEGLVWGGAGVTAQENVWKTPQMGLVFC